MYIRSDAPGIIQNTVNRYFDIKEGKSVSTTKGWYHDNEMIYL
jgi:hypothetical protein